MKLDQALNQKNIIIYFFMIGCPHCERTKPIWEEFKQEPGYKYIEIEAQDVPDEKKTELGIQGFPHFLLIDSKRKRKSVSGSKSSVQELKDAFSLGSFSGGQKKTRKYKNNGSKRGKRKSRRRA
jgi:thiol-disulfide isomerase/thioredoxin